MAALPFRTSAPGLSRVVSCASTSSSTWAISNDATARMRSRSRPAVRGLLQADEVGVLDVAVALQRADESRGNADARGDRCGDCLQALSSAGSRAASPLTTSNAAVRPARACSAAAATAAREFAAADTPTPIQRPGPKATTEAPAGRTSTPVISSPHQRPRHGHVRSHPAVPGSVVTPRRSRHTTS